MKKSTMKNEESKRERLSLWKERLERCAAAYSSETVKMEARERLYLGGGEIDSEKGGAARRASHVRNIVAELIEAQVDSAVPQPKVSARRQCDQWRAKLIEDMLRNELDRLPFEKLNDQQERTAPLQGGSLMLVEWDSRKRSHQTVGELSVQNLHPSQFIPQAGVYTHIEDMDYCFVLIGQTKQYIYQRYGVSVEAESAGPAFSGHPAGQSELVTQISAYYRNSSGGVGVFAWCGDTVIEDIEDYQARRPQRCADCGAVLESNRSTCRVCGGTDISGSENDWEYLSSDIIRSDGSILPCRRIQLDGRGGYTAEAVRIPFYKPNVFPVVLRKNVSVYGRFLGDSDADKISDQQNTIKKLSTKVNEKLLKGGSYVTFPAGVHIDKSDEELKIITLQSAADKALIDVYNIQPNITGDLAYQSQVYEEARQAVGITDSYLGRTDYTAQSGTAKKFAAAQSAGRLESKRVMKHAGYAELFEIMFKFKLAYADEPRPVVSSDTEGHPVYKTWSRYDFLEQDEAGEWYYVDDFLFSCDATSALANNRDKMWEETRLNLQQGAFGNPGDINTLILFWRKMEMLHYPGAADTREYLENKQKEASRSNPVSGLEGSVNANEMPVLQ